MKMFFLSLALLNIVVFSFVFFQFPHLHEFLGGEDMLVENLTAFLFFSAGLCSLLYLVRQGRKAARKKLLLIAFLGMLAFLDELSFGERIFHISMPLIGSKKIDAVHDFFKLGYSVLYYKLRSLPVVALALLGAGVLAIAGGLAFRFRQAIVRMFHTVIKAQSFTFVAISAGLLLVAMTIDLDIVYNDYLFLFEELLEMNAGLAMVFAAVSAGFEKFQVKSAVPRVFGRTRVVQAQKV